MTPQVICEALRKAGATILGEDSVRSAGNITKQDMVELGLSGGRDSSIFRKKLLEKLDLPEHMSANALLQALNLLYTLDELQRILMQLGEKND
jgi:ribonuclease M5